MLKAGKKDIIEAIRLKVSLRTVNRGREVLISE